MLEELAERIEKLDGPDREVDWLIAEALDEIPAHQVRTVGFDYQWHRRPDSFTLFRAKDSEGRNVETWSPKARTASLDAAMTLVPEGKMFTVSSHDNGKPAASIFERDEYGERVTACKLCVSATPALALCAAALRALAKEE